jgi:hypothetical protein
LEGKNFPLQETIKKITGWRIYNQFEQSAHAICGGQPEVLSRYGLQLISLIWNVGKDSHSVLLVHQVTTGS